jgi:hypothetical protein
MVCRTNADSESRPRILAPFEIVSGESVYEAGVERVLLTLANGSSQVLSELYSEALNTSEKEMGPRNPVVSV